MCVFVRAVHESISSLAVAAGAPGRVCVCDSTLKCLLLIDATVNAHSFEGSFRSCVLAERRPLHNFGSQVCVH